MLTDSPGTQLYHLHLCSRLSLDAIVFQGYTIPLDKRLAADGRGLQTVHINENFAKLAEALYIADRKVFPLFFIITCFRISAFLLDSYLFVHISNTSAECFHRPEKPWR